jgi:hypothetical protein
MDSLKYISTKTFEVLKQQQEEPNVKPAFCHQTPPTPKVGEAYRLHRTNYGGCEATRTSIEAQ